MIRLGDTVRDKVSGFVGVVTARTTFLYSRPEVGVNGIELTNDGSPRDRVWFPESQVEKHSVTKAPARFYMENEETRGER